MNQKGSAFLGVMFTMLILGFTGIASVEMTSGERGQVTNDTHVSQAQYLVIVGLEEAKRSIDNGLSPDVVDKPFGAGTYTITSDPASSSVTVTAQVGMARTQRTLGISYADSCVYLDTSSASVSGAHLKGIKLVKTCNTAEVVTGITMDWNFGNCEVQVTEAECDDEADAVVDYGPYADPDHAGKILVCHVPPGNPEAAHTISISTSGWENGHDGGTGEFHNLDFLGDCSNPPQEEYAEVCPDPVEELVCNYDEGSEHGGATVNRVALDSTTVYDTANEIGEPEVTGADPAELIDLVDSTLTGADEYLFQGEGENPDEYITFNQDLPASGYYTLTVHFADGTDLTESFFALGNEEADAQEAGDVPGFEVDDGEVIVNPGQNIDLEILGSSITYGAGGPEVDVKVDLGTVGSDESITWSDLFSAGDVDGGEAFTTATGQSNVSYIVRATATYKKKFAATYDSRNTNQVKTLVNGDQVPPLAGFGGQKPVGDFLAAYLDAEGKIILEPNQVIMLFELGVNMASDPTSPAADFQDLVLVFTFESQEDVYYQQVGGTLNNNN